MATLNLTTAELRELARAPQLSIESQNISVKAAKALGQSVPVYYDNSIENFTKRIIAYKGKEYGNVKETEVLGKWAKMLANRVSTFLNRNGLKPSETLAKELGTHNAKEFKELHPEYRYVNQLYRGIKAFRTKEFPREDTFIGKLLKAILAVLGVIDGRFGRYVLKPQIRYWWRWVTYGTLVVLTFIYILIPIMEWWQAVVDYINYVRWYS